jgi:hypothetical protein
MATKVYTPPRVTHQGMRQTPAIPTIEPRGIWHGGALLRAAKRVLLGLTGLALAVIFALLAAHRAMQLKPTAMPGIAVADIPVGGLSSLQIQATLARRWPPQASITLTDLQDPGRQWQVPAHLLGLQIDTAATVEKVMAYGHSGNPLQDLVEMVYLSRQGRAFEPVLRYDPSRARQALSALASAVYIQPLEADLHVSRAGIVTRSGAPGRELDVEATLQFMQADPRAMLEYRLLPLITRALEPTISDARPWAEIAGDLMRRPYALRLYDPILDETYPWEPRQEEMAQWLLIERWEDRFQVSLNEHAIRADLAQWIASFGPDRAASLEDAWAAVLKGLENGKPETLILQYQPMTIPVNPQESLLALARRVGMPFWKIQEYNPPIQGLGAVGVSRITLPPKDAMLPLPVVLGKRIIISIENQRLWVIQDGEVLREFVVSTGIASSPTLPGVFQVKSHYPEAYASIWDLYMPHFMGIYDAVPGFENGLHGLPTLSNGHRLWDGYLGTPISYGCIVLGLEEAEWLYGWAEEGVVVEILEGPYAPSSKHPSARALETTPSP